MVATKSSVLAVAAALSVPLTAAAPIEGYPTGPIPYGLGPEVGEEPHNLPRGDEIVPSAPIGTTLPRVQPILPRQTDDSGVADAGIEAGIDAGSQALADLIVKKRQTVPTGNNHFIWSHNPTEPLPSGEAPENPTVAKRQQDVGEGVVDTAELLGLLRKRQAQGGNPPELPINHLPLPTQPEITLNKRQQDVGEGVADTAELLGLLKKRQQDVGEGVADTAEPLGLLKTRQAPDSNEFDFPVTNPPVPGRPNIALRKRQQDVGEGVVDTAELLGLL